MALYEAPLQMLCDSPAKYRRNRESLAFMAAMPVRQLQNPVGRSPRDRRGGQRAARPTEIAEVLQLPPVTWDETRGIAGAPDSFVVLARRRGPVWYVAGVTNADGRACEFDTSFLGGGEWLMESFRDNPQQGGAEGDATAYLHETTSVREGERLTFKMASGGGFVARFSER